VSLLLIPGMAAAAYAALLLVVYLMQDRILFPADRDVYRDPSAYGWDFEEVDLAVAGETTCLWWVPLEDARGVVLFSHGNAGNIADRLESIGLLRSFGLSVACYDYGGYGRSTGAPSEKRACADARAVWRWLTEERGVAPEDIILFGRSLGGAVTADLAPEVKPAGVVLESTFLSAAAVGRRSFPWLPLRLILKHPFESDRKVGRIQAPVMVIHSPEDRVIPYTHGRRLFELAAEPKRFVEIRGDHNTGFVESEDAYRAAWEDFLRDVLPAPYPSPRS